MLHIDGLTAGYGGTKVLHGLRLEVNERELVGLLGPNGHGKTTLLRAISGLVQPDSGKILFDGRDITSLDPGAIVGLGIIHVPQGDMVFPEMTVENNLFMGAQRRTAWALRRESLAEVLDVFPRLAERRRQLAGTLSGGERRMLALARGMMAKPRLLIVDEPSLGLAPTVVRDLYSRMEEVRSRGVTMLVVEEQTQYIRHMADRFYLMERGEAVEHGIGKEELNMDDLLHTYLAAGRAEASATARAEDRS